MKQLLTDLTIWTGAIIGALTIFDWLLSEKQKDNLRRCGEDLWLWLSDQKAGRFIRAFTALKVQFVISVALWGIANVLAVADLFRSDRGEFWDRMILLFVNVYMLACLVFVSWKVHPRVLGWISKSESVGRYFWRCIAAYAVCFVTLVAFNVAMVILPRYMDSSVFSLLPLPLPLLFLIATLLVIGPIGVESALLFVIIVLSAAWCAIVWIGLGLIRTMQFILLRIVDNPKGPVLGMSGLLVGIAALVKAFL